MFGTDEANAVRMLGSWIGPGEDVKNRIKRGMVCDGESRRS